MSKILLVDLSAIYWQAWHASGESEISAARQGTLAGVQRAIDKSAADFVAICCDSPRNARKDLLATYKANRPAKDHAAVGELEAVKARLVADGHLLWTADGFEADDVIATACMCATELSHEVVIATGDKDLLQLVQDGQVSVLNTRDWSDYNAARVVEKFGVSPASIPDYLALVGDSSDGYPGLAGWGPKSSAAVLARFRHLEHIPEDYRDWHVNATSPGRLAQTLIRERERAYLFRTLATLRTDVPLFDDVDQLRANKFQR